MSNNNNNLVQYQTPSGEITLTNQLVRQSIAVGDNITDGEVFNFMQLCKFKKLNPFLKEAYLVKYSGKCSTIVGLSVFQKRLNNHKLNEGFELGVITINSEKVIHRHEGTFFPKEYETLVGAYVIFKKKGCIDLTWTVSLDDYIKKVTDKYTKKLRPQGQWQDMPAVMITKCCFVAGVRYFYPEEFGGMYSADEIGIDENEIIEIIQPIEDFQIEELKKASISKKYKIDSDSLINYILENCVVNNVLESEKIEEIPMSKFKIVFDLITKYRIKKEKEIQRKKEDDNTDKKEIKEEEKKKETEYKKESEEKKENSNIIVSGLQAEEKAKKTDNKKPKKEEPIKAHKEENKTDGKTK